MAQSTLSSTQARIAGGIPEVNSSLFWRLGFSVGDPVAIVETPSAKGTESVLILRDIEMERARKQARVDRVACPADFAPPEGLSGDRETATAQAAAECLRRAGVKAAVGHRSLPLIFVEMARRAGIAIECDPELWIQERRRKTEEEIALIRQSQQTTEAVIRMACETIAAAQAGADGVLVHDGAPLTSERVRAMIDHYLLDRGYANVPAIIAGGPGAADCHWLGHGPLRTGEPVIVDVFPCNSQTRYNGDCTRTVVHGEISDEIRRMHAAVQSANAAAKRACRAGVTGEDVHRATLQAILDAGYCVGLPKDDAPDSYCAMTHGTGHGVGLDVHEPPLLDLKGPALLAGETVTIEPGLYSRELGGVRIEDIVVVREAGCECLNTLYDGLEWR